MKTIKNTFGLIGYTLLTITGITYIANKISDRLKWNDPPDEPTAKEPIKSIKTKSTYVPNEWKEKDFNKWIGDIHKQLN